MTFSLQLIYQKLLAKLLSLWNRYYICISGQHILLVLYLPYLLSLNLIIWFFFHDSEHLDPWWSYPGLWLQVSFKCNQYHNFHLQLAPSPELRVPLMAEWTLLFGCPDILNLPRPKQNLIFSKKVSPTIPVISFHGNFQFLSPKPGSPI